jgi:hypothetical protein
MPTPPPTELSASPRARPATRLSGSGRRGLEAALVTFTASTFVVACGGDGATHDAADAGRLDASGDAFPDSTAPLDIGVDHERAPAPALADVTRITYDWSAFDATISRQDIAIDLKTWQLSLSNNGAALPSRPLDADEQRQVTTFLAAPATLAALTAPEACGHDVLDFGETVTVDVGNGHGPPKVITLCEQPVFVTLRTLWQRLRDQHFCEGVALDQAPFICVRGSVGGPCDDTGPHPICTGGHLACPAVPNAPPLVPSNQCRCNGIGCSLPDAGPDGGGGDGGHGDAAAGN